MLFRSALKFEFLPEPDEPEEEASVVRKKKLELRPMNTEEAILEMEMLQHDFFLFLNMESDSISLIYKRKDGNYGMLDTEY